MKDLKLLKDAIRIKIETDIPEWDELDDEKVRIIENIARDCEVGANEIRTFIVGIEKRNAVVVSYAEEIADFIAKQAKVAEIPW